MIVKTTIGPERQPCEISILSITRLTGTSQAHVSDECVGYEFMFSFAEEDVDIKPKFKGVSPCMNWSYVYTLDNKPVTCFCVGIGWPDLDRFWADNKEIERHHRHHDLPER